MNALARQSRESRADFFNQYAATAHLPTFIVEKDFWVCWLLGRIFDTPDLGEHCVFKGGTSLSKVFGVINRFSEDIDLGLSPASLGWKESDLNEAPSSTARLKRVGQIEADCAVAVDTHFRPKLESVVRAELGARTAEDDWITYDRDVASHSPVLYFAYPQSVSAGSYIAPVVKLEFGALTDQRPTGRHAIRAMVAELAPTAFDDFGAEVVALELERTFWEKATILHAEFHRPEAQPLRDRYARHYADFVALWRDPRGRIAAANLGLLQRVRLHKSRFFASSWAHYETAEPGSLRLAPALARESELRRDYAAMQPMFLSPPPSYPELLATLREAEQTINGGG